MISALLSQKYGSWQESSSACCLQQGTATSSWAPGTATHTPRRPASPGQQDGTSLVPPWEGRDGRGLFPLFYCWLVLASGQSGTIKALTSTACGGEMPRDFFSHKHPELLAKVVIYKPHYAIKTNRLDASECHSFYANAKKASFGTLMVRAQRGKGP